MNLDLHIHSLHSRDASASPKEIVRKCRALGMAGFSITDHNAVAGSLEAYGMAKAEGLLAVRGSEVSSAEGHVLAYGIQEIIPRGLPLVETVEAIRDAGGLPVAAHPRRFPSGMGLELAEKGGFSAIEVLNGGSSSSGNRAAKLLADRLGISQTGGSDAHKIGEVGRAYTVLDSVYTEDQVLDALSKGKARAGGRNRSTVKGFVYSVETLYEWISGGIKRL